jgi:hypothetical protein
VYGAVPLLSQSCGRCAVSHQRAALQEGLAWSHGTHNAASQQLQAHMLYIANRMPCCTRLPASRDVRMAYTTAYHADTRACQRRTYSAPHTGPYRLRLRIEDCHSGDSDLCNVLCRQMQAVPMLHDAGRMTGFVRHGLRVHTVTQLPELLARQGRSLHPLPASLPPPSHTTCMGSHQPLHLQGPADALGPPAG